MKPQVEELRIYPQHLEVVGQMSRYELDDLANAIQSRRLELIAAELTERGITARHVSTFTDPAQPPIYWSYVLVYAPKGATTRQNAWARLDECRRLLDTLANLPPAQAYDRWYPKVEPEEAISYTEADARRDVRAERLELRRQLAEGEIDGGMFRDLYRAAGDYMDLAR